MQPEKHYALGKIELLDCEEYEPTLVTAAPIIDVDELTAWLARYPEGEVSKLAEVVSCS